MAVKNRIILRALREREDFDERFFLAVVQREFLSLAADAFDELERVTAARESAKNLEGRPTHNTDFRKVDLPVLKRRIKVLARLAEALTVAGNDDAFSRTLISAARETALNEIADAVSTQPHPGNDPEYREGLEERRRLLAADLEKLAESGNE